MSSDLQFDVCYLKLGVAPSGKRLWRSGRHGVFAGKTVRSMPERFEIYTMYKRRCINTLPFLFPLMAIVWADRPLVKSFAVVVASTKCSTWWWFLSHLQELGTLLQFAGSTQQPNHFLQPGVMVCTEPQHHHTTSTHTHTQRQTGCMAVVCRRIIIKYFTGLNVLFD